MDPGLRSLQATRRRLHGRRLLIRVWHQVDVCTVQGLFGVRCETGRLGRSRLVGSSFSGAGTCCGG